MPTSSNAGSVEVQAPPGLETVSGFRGPSPFVAPGSTGPGSSIGPIAPPKPEGFKDELVREVTAAVREHIEWKTASAVDSLWQKGQRAMQHLQEQQIKQTSQLQSQLAACAEAHQQLQRENAMLRSGLEALMKHLTLVFGPPPHMPGVPQPDVVAPVVPPSMPSMPPADCTPTSRTSPLAASSSPFFPTSSAPMPQPGQAPLTASHDIPATAPAAPGVSSQSPGDAEDFHTPAGSPVIGATAAVDDHSVPPVSITPGIPGFPLGAPLGETGSEAQSPLQTPLVSNVQPEAATFSLTLRRADNVPLGLDVLGEPDSECLLVGSIKPGGAVEAWNRQCHGDAREIRPGDRILMINGAKDADSMREECLQKHLLRMSVTRGPRERQIGYASPRIPASTASSTTSGSGHGGLRADADEFVPQVRSWSTYAARAATPTSC